ncbi:B-box type zinc finger family protein [Actinidia rufa]|uniref:B-box type zinc finger family protein n=1 Tax=Actinidia rufa TaxID=165716 RepID=A0A7J0FK89_9ERIC|nr:B-box type zinc finger family protein [Actinidia rufa]
MKRCELCKSAAMIFCESDQASLCWDCDAKVHSANFLVARHSRTLLCHVCQSPTAWSASGGRLGRTVSVCHSCVDGCERVAERERGDGDEIDVEEDEYGDYDDQDDEDDDDENEEEEVSGDDEDGDNQVVPWSSTPPRPATSSSSSEDSSNRFSNGDRAVSLKRLYENEADPHSDDDLGCSSSFRKISAPPAGESEAALVDSLRPSKRGRTEPIQSVTVQHGPAGSRTAAVVEFLKRFREQDLTSGNDVSSAIVGICELSKNPGAVDFGSSASS